MFFITAAGATRNLRRFGQSIKRVVREVKEDSGSKSNVGEKNYYFFNLFECFFKNL